MSFLYQRNFRVLHTFLVFFIFITYFPGIILSAVVTLGSLEIYRTHEWLKVEPTVYFHCKDESNTELPDVKKINVMYTFKGQESWQPLTEFPSTKCKRCGIYEKDTIKSDDVFDEWEFCPSDFDDDGKYVRVNEKEFNATFLCTQCLPASNSASGSHNGRKGMHIALVILISAVVSTLMLIGVVMAYKYWQKKKREHDQARFLKLFEDGDDIEDELGLGNVL